MAEQEIRNRITVVESIYHQEFGQTPTVIETRYDRWLESDEQPYTRRLTATEEWQPLDPGWIKEAGLMIIKNLEGDFSTNPTEEEQKDMDSRIIEIAYADSIDSRSLNDTWIIPTGETSKMIPNSVSNLMFHCQHKTARFNLFLFPK